MLMTMPLFSQIAPRAPRNNLWSVIVQRSMTECAMHATILARRATLLEARTASRVNRASSVWIWKCTVVLQAPCSVLHLRRVGTALGATGARVQQIVAVAHQTDVV